MQTSLVIKGTRQEAESAARKRGIAFTFERTVNEVTIGRADIKNRDRLIEWANEPLKKGFDGSLRPGTLLLHTPVPERLQGRPRTSTRHP